MNKTPRKPRNKDSKSHFYENPYCDLDLQEEGESNIRKDSQSALGNEDNNTIKLYLKKLSSIPLLTHEEEIKIAKEVKKGDLKAKRELVRRNLRLVVSIAKKYTNQSLSFLDLVQEGNLGLIRAAEKFDVERGFKFSTYATWWVRQGITRALSDKSRTIRIPVHMIETINKLKKSIRDLSQALGREPKQEEIAQLLNMDSKNIQNVINLTQIPVSIDKPIGTNEDGELQELLEDKFSIEPQEYLITEDLKSDIEDILLVLNRKEKSVVELRFGLNDGAKRTLKEVGQYLGISYPKARQLFTNALKKLRNNEVSSRLKNYLYN